MIKDQNQWTLNSQENDSQLV